ncbi:MAG: hypothetical protein HY574_12105 [candidate division NC10 bacterium]|nr:hypothetical protein [candidate division NC10 bacterium]
MRQRVAFVLAVIGLAVMLATGAGANTELVPGTRIVFPFFDISTGHSTFLLLHNTASLTATVQLALYGQGSGKQDFFLTLTGKDTDQFDVGLQVPGGAATFPGVAGNTSQTNVAGRGWVDVFVVAGASTGSAIVQRNVLAGSAIVVNLAGDFAFAYPGAASQCQSDVGTGGAVVTRLAGSGLAGVWTGQCEQYPSTLFLPGYLAEDLESTPSPPLTAFLVLAGPSDANKKEAPGQDLDGASASLVSIQMPGEGANVDGCGIGSGITIAPAHLVNGRISTVNTQSGSGFRRTNFSPPPGGLCPGSGGPFADELSNSPIAAMKLRNDIDTPTSAATGPVPNTNFTGPNGFDLTARKRGMVGVVFGSATDGGLKLGDTIRLWGHGSTQTYLTCCFGDSPQ